MKAKPKALVPELFRLPEEAERLSVAVKYGLRPDGGRATVFALAERGLPGSVVRYLARKHLGLRGATAQAYWRDWLARHGSAANPTADGQPPAAAPQSARRCRRSA